MFTYILGIILSILPVNLNQTLLFSYQQNPNLSRLEFMQTFNRNTSAINPIVRLYNSSGGFFCTAVVIDIYHALTAAHCVTGFAGNLVPDGIEVRSIADAHISYAHAEGLDNYKDSAIIRGDFRSVQSAAVDLTGNKKLPIGSVVRACGFPSGQYELYCIDATVTGNIGFQIKASGLPLIKGMSGGPVIFEGRVIAVNSAVTEDALVFGNIIGLHTMAVR